MDTNALYKAIMAEAVKIHAGTYRQKPPQIRTYPYVVALIDSEVWNVSSDYYLNIDICDDPSATNEAIEAIADSFQDAFDDLIISNSDVNVHLSIEQRQYVSPDDLTTYQMVNLRFMCRAYYK